MTPNRITICRDEFDTIESFKKSIGDAVNILLENNYTMNIFYDDKGLGIVCIDFDHKDEQIASVYPYWLDLEEADYIDTTRHEKRLKEYINE